MPADPRPEGGLTSILIPVLNQLPLLQATLESIARCTPQRHELVVVDNGSRPEMRAWLATTRARLVLNPRNRGFAAAVNQAVEASRGESLVVLNSDVQVTNGWLAELQEALSRPGVGLAGPVTNNISGPQRVDVDYARAGGPEGVARLLAATRFGALREVPRLVGFCLALTRATAQAVGPFDERFGIGNFEDDDFCLRARLLGLSCVIVESAFVHHEGSATFKGENIDYRELLEQNQQLFLEKWRQPELALLPSLVRRLERERSAA